MTARAISALRATIDAARTLDGEDLVEAERVVAHYESLAGAPEDLASGLTRGPLEEARSTHAAFIACAALLSVRFAELRERARIEGNVERELAVDSLDLRIEAVVVALAALPVRGARR
jgi:hypothetical protein